GWSREIGVVPDLVFGLRFADGSRRCFMVEIDRGTMPITRSDINQTSFERKMRVYLTAYAANQHRRQFGWKAFRVLTATTDTERAQSMMKVAQSLRVAGSPGAALFLFSTLASLHASNPFSVVWRDGTGREVLLA